MWQSAINENGSYPEPVQRRLHECRNAPQRNGGSGSASPGTLINYQASPGNKEVANNNCFTVS